MLVDPLRYDVPVEVVLTFISAVEGVEMAMLVDPLGQDVPAQAVMSLVPAAGGLIRLSIEA